MSLTDENRAFLERHRSAAMITFRADGTPHVARVGLALVDGKLWSSGTKGRLRTRHLRQDPRCTLFVFDPDWSWLTLDTIVTILDGPEVPKLSLRLFRAMQEEQEPAPTPGKIAWFGQEKSLDEFREIMVQEQRLIYEFQVTRAYGLL